MADFVRLGRSDPDVLDVHMKIQNIGYSRFERLFQPRNSGEQTVEAVRALLEGRQLAAIGYDGATEVQGFCLEALHFRGGNGLDPAGFIGMRAPVVHQPTCTASLRKPETEAEVGVLAFGQLPTVQSGAVMRELLALERRQRLRQVVRHTPLQDDRDVIIAAADRRALFALLARSGPSVWHVSSHMEELGGERFFRLDNGADINVQDFRASDCPMFKGHPLVLVNVCSAGQPSPGSDHNLPELLLLRRAAGVIAPILLVDEHFAAGFAGKFYAELLGRDATVTVAEALRAARLAVYQDIGSLAGLGYAFHAFRDFQLATPAPTTILSEAA